MCFSPCHSSPRFLRNTPKKRAWRTAQGVKTCVTKASRAGLNRPAVVFALDAFPKPDLAQFRNQVVANPRAIAVVLYAHLIVNGARYLRERQALAHVASNVENRLQILFVASALEGRLNLLLRDTTAARRNLGT